MIRAISVLVAVVVLIVVGWFFGQRSASSLREEIRAQETRHAERVVELQERTRLAEARGYLWESRAQLLLAAHEVERTNFGNAAERATRAQDLITRAAGIPGNTLELGPVRDTVEGALRKIGAMEADSREILLRAAAELGRLLEMTGRA